MHKKKQPKVSILVPVYGVEPFIERCAKSLFEQTFDDLEYIFVNDCTPDNSINILEKVLSSYPERVLQTKIINHEQNTGIAKVRNTLLMNATGDYVLFIDSDDWVEKNMIEKLYTKAFNENADIAGCDYFLSYSENEIYQHEPYSLDYPTNLKRIISLEIKALLFKLLINRDLFKNNNISFKDGINVGEDYIVCVKLFYYSKKTVSISEALYHYVQYNPSNYSRLNLQNIKDRINAVREVESFCNIKCIIDKVRLEIDGRKLIIKNPFLFNQQYIDYKKWKETFPESNYAWRQFKLSFGQKIIYWLAQHQLFFLIKFIRGIKGTHKSHLLKK